MKYLFAFSLLLFASTALARWDHLGGNRYSDGVWEYEAYQDSRCCWHYNKIRPIAPDASDNSFDTKALGFIERLATQRRNESILEKFSSILGTSGATQQTSYKTYGKSVYQSTPSYFSGGQSFIGQSSYPLRFPVIDPTPLIQEQQRLQDRQFSLSSQSMAGVKDSVDRYTDAAKIQASMDAYARGAQAVVTAAQSTRTEVSETVTEPVGGQQYYATARQPQDHETSVLLALADNVVPNNCASCHGPVKHAAGHDFTSEDLTGLWAKMRKRIHLPLNHPKHMPPNKQLSQTQMDLLDMKFGVPQEVVPQVQPQIDPSVPPQQPYQDNPDVPPAPPQQLQPQPNQGAQKPIGRLLNQFVQMLGQR